MQGNSSGLKLILGLAVLAIFTLSCSLFTSPPMEPVSPVTQEVSNPEVVQEQPSNSEIPAGAALPTGVVTAQNGVLTLFDADGYTIIQQEPPHVNPDKLHIAGAVPQGGTSLPLIYYSFEQNNSLLFYDYGQTTTIKAVPYFADMAGADGQPFIAYTTAEFTDSGLVSNLFIGSPQSLPTAEPVLSDIDPQGWALMALEVDMEGDQPVGIWYSKQPWGIGGDIVFPPRRTLSYLDLRTGAAYQYLSAEANPSALSADRNWVAYTNDSSVEAGVGAMAIRNMISGENISYPLLNAIDKRGAGEASFSPNNQYLAWMEANGWQMAEVPNFHSVVRVGDLNGNVIAEFADTALVGVSGMSTVQRVEPVGWFDDNSLVVMARGEYWGDATLILIDIPTQSARLLAQGVFVGFTYP